MKRERKAEKRRRAEFLGQARDLMPYVSVAAGDDVFFVPTSDFRIGANLFIRRRSKDMNVLARALDVLAELDHRLPPDPVLVEVGANLGTATTTALRRHGFSSAVALEPSPGNIKALRLGLVANELESRVQAIHAAVSDREGERFFDVSHTSCGAHRLLPEGVEFGEGTVTVKVVTLDGLVSGGVIDPGRVGLVWIDTSGHEAAALAGGTSLLQAGIPIVVAVKHGLPDTEAALVDLLPPYFTDVADLRRPDPPRPIGEFRTLIEGLGESTDVLLVRR
jgi:FkbM family methyltransferase